MAEQIPGVPEGWVIERIGKPIFNVDHVIHYDGQPMLCDYDSSYLNRVIIRKIEKPAAYRPFEDAAEYKPHRDRWWRYNDSEDSEHVQPPAAYSKIGPMGSNWEQAFMGRVFDDGTPFGVRIDE
jgi:hypothetical protein